MFEAKYNNLIIAGVNKAGTTSLFSVLARHPEICGSTIKETCYFLPRRYGQKCASADIYEEYFRSRNKEKYLLESTPGYMYGGEPLIDEIKCSLGNSVKIVLVLREPVDRLVSFYRFKKTMLELPKELMFRDYINKCSQLSSADLRKKENNVYFGVEGGKYSEYIEPWLSNFGDDLKVIFFDELTADTGDVVSDLCVWLGIDNLSGQLVEQGSMQNVTAEIKNRKLQSIALYINKRLEAFFRKNNRLKVSLRKFYFFINGGGQRATIDTADLSNMRNYFSKYNKELKSILLKYNIKNLPDWLT